MKVLDRYVVREFLLPLVAGMALFMFALVMNRLFDLMDLVLNRGVPVRVVAGLVGCMLPSIVAVSLPMATLLATVLAFGRLAHDREVLALKGAGISLGRMTRPVASAGLFFALLLLLFNGTVLPAAGTAYKRIFVEIVRERATAAFREREFVREFDRYLLYFEEQVPEDGTLRDVTIVESPPHPPRIITARHGRLHADPEGLSVTLVLENGAVDQPSDLIGENYTRIDFERYELNLDIHDSLHGGRLPGKAMDEMTYGELLARMREHAGSAEERRPYAVVLNQRVALACAPLFVVFLGAPLGALARRGGGLGIVLSIVVIAAYYSLLMVGRGVADRGELPAWLALWIPNAFMAAAGGLGFWAAGREAMWSRWGR